MELSSSNSVYSMRMAPVPIGATLIREGRVSSAFVWMTETVLGRVPKYTDGATMAATTQKARMPHVIREGRDPLQVATSSFELDFIILK